MPNPHDRVLYLLHQYSQGISTTGEEEELFHWMATAKDHSILQEHIGNLLNEPENKGDYSHVNWEQLYSKILEASGQLPQPAFRTHTLFSRIRVAAAILLIIFSASVIYYFTHQHQKKVPATVAYHKTLPVQDVAPGNNKATLQLGDGSLVTLDSASRGELTHQDDTKIIKTGDGALVYKGGTNSSAVVYNTLSTPRGGQYHVTLPDGTEVWLNAASSLRYPTSFNGKERNVDLTGEAYFEVAKAYSKRIGVSAKEERIPFKVHVKGMEVEVLGTHFNVMAYDNEKTLNTTLLEGRVKVHKGNNSSLLSPGQQVQVNNEGEFKMVPDADVDLEIAWKNGYTSFRNMDITGIMRQIERWYDVDVEYEGNVPHRTFSGEVSRSASLSQLLHILEASNINFVIEGRKIKVRP